jgi:hypothetical protein
VERLATFFEPIGGNVVEQIIHVRILRVLLKLCFRMSRSLEEKSLFAEAVIITYVCIAHRSVVSAHLFLPAKRSAMRFRNMLVAFLFLVPAVVLAEEPGAADQKERVQFDGKTFVLAWQNQTDSETVKEYIPADQNLDSWTELASIREYPELNDPKALAASLVKVLEERNPETPIGMIEDPQTGAVIVDFIVWSEASPSPDGSDFVEFNIFKYQNKPDGGVIAQQYALREYKDIQGFIGGLPPVRERLLDQMAKEGLQLLPTSTTLSAGDLP